MHTDTRDIDDGTLIEGDLCIVGAGAAGISMALEWAGTPFRVILLETGGFDYNPELQELYRGNQNLGYPYYPLEAARLHYFGGTTGHWAGYCAPFDPVDFEKRDWVPYSGWPFPATTLDPFYERAQQLLELGPYNYTAEYWQSQGTALDLLNPGEKFWTKIWQFSPPTRFGTRYRDAIVGSSNIHLFTHANVVELTANPAVSAIDGIKVKTPDGKSLAVRSRQYVLACGAIQNARLLLASNRQAGNGLGNDKDLVGRFFMEHLEMPAANLLLRSPRRLKFNVTPVRIQGQPVAARGELALTASAQRDYGILNGTAEIVPGLQPQKLQSSFQNLDPERLAGRHFPEPEAGSNLVKYVYERVMWRLFPEPLPDFPLLTAFHLDTRQEQAPNPDSRITLDFEDRDAMGVPRVNLDWRLTPLDKISIHRFYEILGQSVGEQDLGRVQILDWLTATEATHWPEFLSGGWHHMGTTRMHDSPALGVVDPNCRVYDLGNLHIAGSGVFPTSGAANPTLTLVALSLRLSDHLKTLLAAS